MNEILFPPGLTTRPATLADAADATALYNACAIQQTGRSEFDEAETLHEWQTPSFNLETDTLCVFAPNGQLVGYGEVWNRPPHVVIHSWGQVHPEYQGRGLGAALVAWTEDRAMQSLDTAPSGTRVVLRQGVPGSDTAAQALLTAQNYTQIRCFYRMLIEMTAPPPQPQLPDGIHVRTFVRDKDLPAVIRADQDAFRDHWGFVERSLEQEEQEWTQRIDDDPDFDPELWFLAVNDRADGEEITGLCLCSAKMVEDPEMGWISILGVRRPWRRRGLATALLHQAFGAFYRRGKPRVGLGVDANSLTGATRLYERAGMHIERESYVYEKELRPGEDLSIQSL